jgi:hypothetical protein
MLKIKIKKWSFLFEEKRRLFNPFEVDFFKRDSNFFNAIILQKCLINISLLFFQWNNHVNFQGNQWSKHLGKKIEWFWSFLIFLLFIKLIMGDRVFKLICYIIFLKERQMCPFSLFKRSKVNRMIFCLNRRKRQKPKTY